ncbi:MAG: hypothetical protein J1F39_07220 [Clostridiales bacterium]|nr:hypothetical protein [Clostridiales bacterium]
MDEKVRQNLENLLRYQSVDIELKKLNKLLNSDEALLAMNRSKKAFNDAKQTLTQSEEQSASLVALYEELLKYVADNEELLAELEGAVASDDEQDIAERVKKLESLRGKFGTADKKAHELDEKAKSVVRARVEAIKTGNVAKQKYNDSKAKHGELVASKADEVKRLQTELAKMESLLDKTLFEEYKKLSDDSVFPPVVPAHGDEKKGAYSCGGCGIGLSQQANTLIKDEGWCRCDNCRRIIVKK